MYYPVQLEPVLVLVLWHHTYHYSNNPDDTLERRKLLFIVLIVGSNAPIMLASAQINSKQRAV